MLKFRHFIPLSILLISCSKPISPQEIPAAPASSHPDSVQPATSTPSDSSESSQNPQDDPLCPSDRSADVFLPGTDESHYDVNSWLHHDRTVMSIQAIEQHNARFHDEMYDLAKPVEKSILKNNLQARLDSFREKFQNDEIMFEDGSKPDPDDWNRPLREFDKAYDNYQ